MARPARPASEVQAVVAAAKLIRAETGLTSAKALGREIASRVTAALLDDAQNDPAAAILSGLAGGDPIATLALTQDAAAVDELAARFRDRMLALFGAFIPPVFQQEVQRRIAAHELFATLAERYSRQLRGSGLTPRIGKSQEQ